MLISEGNENGEKAAIGLISKKRNFARAAHFLWSFLCRCFARLQRQTSRNFLVTSFLEEISYAFSFTFFFTAAHFHLALVTARISHVDTAAKKIFMLFFSRSRSLSPFLSLSFAGLPPIFSFSLSLSCSIFQICGHDNKFNALDNTDTETISAFRFRLYLLFTCEANGYAISRQNNLEFHLGCHTC